MEPMEMNVQASACTSPKCGLMILPRVVCLNCDLGYASKYVDGIFEPYEDLTSTKELDVELTPVLTQLGLLKMSVVVEISADRPGSPWAEARSPGQCCNSHMELNTNHCKFPEHPVLIQINKLVIISYRRWLKNPKAKSVTQRKNIVNRVSHASRKREHATQATTRRPMKHSLFFFEVTMGRSKTFGLSPSLSR